MKTRNSCVHCQLTEQGVWAWERASNQLGKLAIARQHSRYDANTEKRYILKNLVMFVVVVSVFIVMLVYHDPLHRLTTYYPFLIFQFVAEVTVCVVLPLAISLAVANLFCSLCPVREMSYEDVLAETRKEMRAIIDWYPDFLSGLEMLEGYLPGAKRVADEIRGYLS